MAPHLTLAELDFINEKKQDGLTPVQIHARPAAQRTKKKIATPHLTNVRKAPNGKVCKRGRVETRGRRPKFTRAMMLRMDVARKKLIKKADNQREVRWNDIRRSARVPEGHRNTLKTAFGRESIPVAARRPREKPQRTAEHEAERLKFAKDNARSYTHQYHLVTLHVSVSALRRARQAFLIASFLLWGVSVCFRTSVCPRSEVGSAKDMCGKKPGYFRDGIDMIIDNKAFDIPTTERARKYLNSQQVRFHLRTPAEGLKNEFTKPGRKKNRMNTGARANVCASVSNGRIVLWHCLPKNWTGQAAADLYKDVIFPTLKRVRGVKRSYRILEDNDPTGYKSNLAKKAKSEKRIQAHVFPRYSPDINPLDFSLWQAVTQRMLQTTPNKLETVVAYKARLRCTALRLPRAVVSKAVNNMAARIRQVKDANGGNIPRE